MIGKLKTSLFVAAIVCLVFLFVPASASADDKTTWMKYNNAVPGDTNTTSTNGRIPIGQTGGDIDAVTYPCVIKDGYFYKMWYTGTAGNSRIYHATCDALPEGTIFYSY